MSDPGTIDVTNVVEGLRQSFVSWAVDYIFGVEIALPGMEWMALPVISSIDREILRIIFDELSKSVIMEAFFLNTAVKKASQAKDFTDAVAFKNALPSSASEVDFENAEKAQMVAFRRFVSLTS